MYMKLCEVWTTFGRVEGPNTVVGQTKLASGQLVLVAI